MSGYDSGDGRLLRGLAGPLHNNGLRRHHYRQVEESKNEILNENAGGHIAVTWTGIGIGSNEYVRQHETTWLK